MSKTKAISAEPLEINLKEKTGRNGGNKMKQEETGRSRKTGRKKNPKNRKKLDDTKRNRKKQEETGRPMKKQEKNRKKRKK